MAEPIALHLQNDHLAVQICNVGASIMSVKVPDRSGRRENVCLPLGDPANPETLHRYRENGSNFGAVVGRFANRIGGASFELDGSRYELEANNGPNNLHSGSSNVARIGWECVEQDDTHIRLRVVSPDGAGGFPGEVTIEATYTLDGPTLLLRYTARTTAPTVVNLTNHAYWNLAGVTCDAAGCSVPHDVRDHVLHLHADRRLAVDDNILPTGEIVPVKETPFDFTSPRAIGATWERQSGYDHCFVVNEAGSSPTRFGGLRSVGSIVDPASGRRMTLHGSQPGVQFYTANHFCGSPGDNGFKAFEGLAIEGENFPDAPNQPSFPTSVLRPGETYDHAMAYTFTVDRT